MSQDRLQTFFEAMQQAFFAGDVETLCRYFSLPLVVYSAAGVVVMRDKDEFAKMVDDYRTALMATSVVQGELTVLSRDAVENNRRKAVVRTVELDADGHAIASSVIRYFLLEGANGLAIEMMEYLEIPLPLADVEKIVH